MNWKKPKTGKLLLYFTIAIIWMGCTSKKKENETLFGMNQEAHEAYAEYLVGEEMKFMREDMQRQFREKLTQEWWSGLTKEWKRAFRENTPFQGEPDSVQLLSIANVTCFDIEGYQIDDLYPLRGLFNIQALNCANTQVHTLYSIKWLNGIKVLDISNTEVVDLSPLHNYSRLKKIWLSDDFMEFGDIRRINLEKKFPDCIIQSNREEPFSKHCE